MTTRRRVGAASATALLGLLLAFATAEVFIPQWPHRLGLDVWNWHKVRAEARQHEQEAAAVEAHRVQLRREVEIANHIAAKLIARQITLLEAIDELSPILQHRIGFEHAWPHDPPPTFRHAVARYAITRVEAELANDPARPAEIVGRLKADYAALK
ncbi:MAG: hypothetical protein U0792_04955 [Gemmataceae bacterium]